MTEGYDQDLALSKETNRSRWTGPPPVTLPQVREWDFFGWLWSDMHYLISNA